MRVPRPPGPRSRLAFVLAAARPGLGALLGAVLLASAAARAADPSPGPEAPPPEASAPEPLPAEATAEPAADLETALPLLHSLHFDGLGPASARNLEKLMLTPLPPPWWKVWAADPGFSEGSVEQDAERIARHYRTLGYFEAQVRPELDWDDAHRRAELTFHIEPGTPVRLVSRGIEIPPSLASRYPADHFVEGLPLEEGEVFSLERYDDAKTELLARLANAGHPLAEVTGGADVDVRTHEARLTWRVEPGPLVRFGAVTVEGLERVRESLVRREVTLEPGEVYSLDALRKTRDGIQSLALFRSVIVGPRPEDAEPGSGGEVIWPVTVQIVERPPRTVEVGVGYGTDDKLRGQLAYQQRNFFGHARILSTRLRYSAIRRSFHVDLEQPHFLAREQSLHLESWLGQENTPGYDAERLVGDAGVIRKLDEAWSVRFGYEASWSAIGDVSGEADRLLDDPERRVFLSGLRLGVRRSTVADPLDGRDGSWVDLAVTPWIPALGSNVGFLSTELRARIYRPLGPTVVAGRLRLGSLQPFADAKAAEIPPTERFYSGGGNSVRGFSYWGLGPRRADGSPVGGASVLEGSLELRFPIWREIGGVVFVDAGQVDLDPWGWKPGDLTYSTGFGLRYSTPLGPIRLDLAYPINPPKDADTSYFYFSIGQAF